MADELLGVELTQPEILELDRLAEYFADGDRTKLIRLALQIMSAKERTERLVGISETGREQIRRKRGRDLTEDELNELTSRIAKNKAPGDRL